MMSEGTVDVSGSTVKVDTSGELANLYKIARRAKDDNNGENAAKYYDMIQIKDPLSWEAAFYVVYFKAMECKIGQIRSAAISVANCVDTVLDLIKENVASKAEQIDAVVEVSARCTVISDLLYNAAENHYNGIGSSIKANYTQEMVNNCCAARDIMYILGNSIESIFSDYEELHIVAANVWKNGIKYHKSLMTYFADAQGNKDMIMGYVSKVQKYDPSYTMTVEIFKPQSSASASSGGCYVATAVYGSYDCPQVWTLRRYRDYTLAETWYGRAFIHTYYAISPTLVKWFGQTEWFKNMWKPKLDRMVEKLQSEGVESTPYEDKEW